LHLQIYYDMKVHAKSANVAGQACAFELGNLCAYGWTIGSPAYTDVLPARATVKALKIEADGTPCGGVGASTRAFLNGIQVGTAAYDYQCDCNDCATRKWEDAALPDGWGAKAYRNGQTNTVSFTENLFAWAAVRVTVTYEVGQSTPCVCPAGYAYDTATAACQGG
jgi:hypothetical protein